MIWWPRGGNPGNLIVYRGSVFPAWQGNVLIATMSNRALGPGLVRAVIGDNGALVHEERMLTEIGTRMRDVVAGARREDLRAHRSLGVRVAGRDPSGRAGGRARSAAEATVAGPNPRR